MRISDWSSDVCSSDLNTEFITGVFHVSDNDKCAIDITLNGEKASIPLTPEMVSDTEYLFKGTMDLHNWKALDDVSSLNEACKILHTRSEESPVGKEVVSRSRSRW